MRPPIGGVLQGDEVRRAVAAPGAVGADVLRDDVLEGRVELGGPDLEGEPERAGGGVGPVLGGADPVVELVAALVGVAVLGGEARAEAAQGPLVGSQAEGHAAVGDVVRGAGPRPQHEVAGGVVGDQRRDLPRQHEVADVAGLGLGEGVRAVVARVEQPGVELGDARGGPGGARAAPPLAVVAVEVHPQAEARRRGQHRRAGAVGGVDPGDEAAVLSQVGQARGEHLGGDGQQGPGGVQRVEHVEVDQSA